MIKQLRKYRPPLFIARSVVQLFWLTRIWRDFEVEGKLLKTPERLKYDRDIIPLSDGGTMSVDWYWPDELCAAADGEQRVPELRL